MGGRHSVFAASMRAPRRGRALCPRPPRASPRGSPPAAGGREPPAVPAPARAGHTRELRTGDALLDDLDPRPGLLRALSSLVRARLGCACTRGARARALLGGGLRARVLRGRCALHDRLRLPPSPRLTPPP